LEDEVSLTLPKRWKLLALARRGARPHIFVEETQSSEQTTIEAIPSAKAVHQQFDLGIHYRGLFYNEVLVAKVPILSLFICEFIRIMLMGNTLRKRQPISRHFY